jgi:hypothetical protein
MLRDRVGSLARDAGMARVAGGRLEVVGFVAVVALRMAFGFRCLLGMTAGAAVPPTTARFGRLMRSVALRALVTTALGCALLFGVAASASDDGLNRVWCMTGVALVVMRRAFRPKLGHLGFVSVAILAALACRARRRMRLMTGTAAGVLRRGARRFEVDLLMAALTAILDHTRRTVWRVAVRARASVYSGTRRDARMTLGAR